MELIHLSWTSFFASPLTTLTLILISLCLIFFRHQKLNLPPGPRSWPIIGNLNLISGKNPHMLIHALSEKYGPIMQLKFGSIPMVVGSSTEMAEAFLKTYDVTFANRPKMAAGKYTGYNFTSLGWQSFGPQLIQARKICFTELFSAKRLKSFEYIRVEELNLLLKYLYDTSGESVLLKDLNSDMSLNVTSRMILSKKYTNKPENEMVTRHEIKEMLDELMFLNGVFDIGDAIPWLGFLDLQGNIKRMKKVAKDFDQFMEHEIDEHNARRKGIKNFAPQDMVDVLLQLADDPTLEVKIDRIGIKGFISGLFIGTETSTAILEWAFTELLKNPEIFKKATEELDKVIGRERWVEEKDIDNLSFINNIVKETMRLHMPPLLSPRMSSEDCKVGSYDIPKGTRVIINTWTISRNPALWENPYEFFPERFLGKSIDVKGTNFELLPFGAGRRMCPAYNFAFKAIQLSLANLLHGFEWSLPGNMSNNELHMEEILKLSNQKNIPLEVVARPRLSSHLYKF